MNQTFNKEAFMPRGDGTGPAGMGPRTGRAAGFCAGYPLPGYANQAGGRGFGGGFGRGGGRGGRGFRNQYCATGQTGWQRAAAGYGYGPAVPFHPYTPTEEQETEMLRTQSEYLENELSGIRQRLQILEDGKGKKPA